MKSAAKVETSTSTLGESASLLSCQAKNTHTNDIMDHLIRPHRSPSEAEGKGERGAEKSMNNEERLHSAVSGAVRDCSILDMQKQRTLSWL